MPTVVLFGQLDSTVLAPLSEGFFFRRVLEIEPGLQLAFRIEEVLESPIGASKKFQYPGT
jgi:hypothetical protein